MSIPQYPKFKQIELSDKKEIVEWFTLYPQSTCEMNFINLFIWRHFDHNSLTTVNGNLLIHCAPPNEPAFCYPPIGNNKIKETFEHCLSSSTPRFSRVPESFISRYLKDSKIITAIPDHKNFDYIYLTRDLIELSGKKYDGKRNHIKRFKKNFKYEYRRLKEEDYNTCIRTLLEWEKTKKYFADVVIKSQEDAIREVFLNFKKLDIIGAAILINQKIEAFSIASLLNPDMANIHFEIANPNFAGIFPALTWEFVKNELSQFKFVNREQDLGLPGLRQAKLSWHPHHLEKKFNVTAVLQG